MISSRVSSERAWKRSTDRAVREASEVAIPEMYQEIFICQYLLSSAREVSEALAVGRGYIGEKTADQDDQRHDHQLLRH